MTWKIVGDTFTIFGTGATPRIEPESPLAPPPPNPTPTPTPLPPLVDDTSPFAWPPQPRDADYPDERWTGLGQNFYAAQPKYRNPLPGANWYAGLVAPGVMHGYAEIGGYALWAPRDAAPASIRRALLTGRP
jgi:hypothetical protein